LQPGGSIVTRSLLYLCLDSGSQDTQLQTHKAQKAGVSPNADDPPFLFFGHRI
jgi:hypothetical protein